MTVATPFRLLTVSWGAPLMKTTFGSAKTMPFRTTAAPGFARTPH